MLFFNKKYLLSRIKTEKITEKGFKQFKDLLKSHKDAEILDDNDLEKYTNVLINYAHKQIVSNSTEFFKQHGIYRFMDDIIDQFLKSDNYDKLNDIINGKGLITLSELVDSDNKNIFNLCTGFENEAKHIALLTGTEGNKTEGNFETLLRFILKDGYKPAVGDVGVDGKTIEIKTSGAHPNSQGVAKDNIIFYIIDKELKKYISDEIWSDDELGITNYVNERGDNFDLFDARLEVYINNGGTAKSLLNAIVNAVCEQFKKWKHFNYSIVESKLKSIASEYTSAIASNSITVKQLKEMLGRMQVCAYMSSYDYTLVINNTTSNYLVITRDNCVEASKLIKYGTISTSSSARPCVSIDY